MARSEAEPSGDQPDGERSSGVAPRAAGERRWRREAALYALAAAVAVASLARTRAFFHDDAYITLRYAQSFLAGKGLVWSTGSYVEGFTHPLWLLQVLGLGAMGLDLETAARALGIAYLGGLLALWIASRARAELLLLVVTLHGVVLWANGGLELCGFAFWLAAGSWQALAAERAARRGEECAARHGAAAGLCFAAAALMRPEGAACGLAAAAFVALARDRRTGVALGLALVLPLLAWIEFRLLYYGDWLPNTARAKIGGLPLAAQLFAGAAYLWKVRGEWLPAAAFAAAALGWRRDRGGLAAAAFALPVFAGILLGGGDHMPGARLVLPAVVVWLFAAALPGRLPLSGRGWALGVALLAVWQALPTFLEPTRNDRAAEAGRTLGRILEQQLPPGTLVAAATAGSIPYFAPSLRFIDTLGLNDRAIASRRAPLGRTVWQAIPGHTKGWGEYVLGLRPEVILLGPVGGTLGLEYRSWFLSDYELVMHPAFYALYTPWVFGLRREPDGSVHAGGLLYLRNDAPLPRLRPEGRPLEHAYPGPPDPGTISLEEVRPVRDHPPEVPLRRPLGLLRRRLAGA
jgi:hypothetical protein